MQTGSFIQVAAFASIILLAQATPVRAAEVIVLSSGASRSAVTELGKLYGASTGRKTTLSFDNNPILKQRIEEGARFDVLIIEPDFIDGLMKQGHVAPGSRRDLARVGMALGARAGTPKLELRTVEDFVNVVRDAQSIAYTADGHSGTVFLATLQRLGLLDALKPKLKPAIGRTASSLVINGEAQMWAGPISTPTRGAQIVGRFPEAIQTYVGISAATSASPLSSDAAAAFIEFLRSEQARSVFFAKGFEPLTVP